MGTTRGHWGCIWSMVTTTKDLTTSNSDTRAPRCLGRNGCEDIPAIAVGQGCVLIDHFVTTRPGVVALFEAEDPEHALSLSGWVDYLESAKANGGATAALGIVASPEQMPGGGRVRVICETMLLVAFDPEVDGTELVLACYQLLCLQAVSVALAGSAAHVELGELRRDLDAAMDALAGFDTITKATSRARVNLDQVDTGALGARQQLSAILARCAQRLAGPPAVVGAGR